MGILICDKKSRQNNKPTVVKSNKIDVENNSTNETEKNNNNNNINANLPLREQPTNDKLEIKEENNAIKEASDDKQVVTLDSKVFIAKGNNDPNKLYIKKKILGRGSFGIVYLVKQRYLSRYFAMKVIKKSQTKAKEEEENLMNEVDILRKLDHPNIVKITDFYSLKTEYNIITEYCQEGELFDEIKANSPFNEALAAWYLKQILSAVSYCHNMNIIHRDLKPENILIVKRQKNGFHPIKIIDFGTAKVFQKEKAIMKKIKDGVYDLKKYPWGVISEEAKDLLKGLLQVNTKKRLTAKAALEHKWFKIEKTQSTVTAYNVKHRQLNKLIDNLMKYRSDNILRCAVIALLVHNSIQLNQAHDAVKLFNQIDKNGDGKISKDELFNGLQPYKKDISDEQLRKQVDIIFNNIDSDHNGYLEYEEFVRAAIDKDHFLSVNFLQFAFNYFDKDHDGEITLEEVKNKFFLSDKNRNSVKAQEQLQKSFNEIDINGDGKLSFEEFGKMMENIIKRD